MSVGLTTNYFSSGSGAPSGAPSVASGEYALYEDTTNGDLYEWNLSGTPGWTKIFDHAGGGGGGGSGLYSAYICCQDQEAQNTQGPNATSGSWQTRVLNTKVADTGSHASLASNQITLDAGTYRVEVFAASYNCTNTQLRLQNITDTATLVVGQSVYIPASMGGIVVLQGRFTLSGSKVIELQQQVALTATNGFGVAANFGTEIYATVELWKES